MPEKKNQGIKFCKFVMQYRKDISFTFYWLPFAFKQFSFLLTVKKKERSKIGAYGQKIK